MSDLSPLNVHCHQCKARPGEQCVGRLHKVRKDTAVKAAPWQPRRNGLGYDID